MGRRTREVQIAAALILSVLGDIYDTYSLLTTSKNSVSTEKGSIIHML